MATERLDFVPDTKLRFESQRVKILLRQFGFGDEALADTIHTIRAASALRGTSPYLTFQALYEVERYYSFPVRFHCLYVGGVDELRHFGYAFRLDHTYLVERFLLQHGVQHGDGRETVLVTNMPTVKGGVVVHALPDAKCARGDTIVKCHVPDIGTVHVQPYKSFAWWVATKWMRGEPLREGLEAAADDAQLFRGHTPGTAYLYVWLRSKWRGLAATEAIGGTSYMRLTHPLIAEDSGLSIAVIKRGMDRLRQAGLIETLKGDRCLYVALTG